MSKVTKKRRVFVGFVFLLIVAAVVFLSVSAGKTRVRQEKNIPKIDVSLNGVSLNDINEGDKNTKYYDNYLVVYDGKEKNEYSGLEIKGRGNASWEMEKKSYRIKLNNKVDLLSLGKRKKWGLISNWLDDSFLRNDLGHYLGDILVDDYPTRGEFVELEIDNRNLGLYYLIDLMSIDKKSVDLRDSTGILAEINNAYCENDDVWEKSAIFRDCIAIKDVVEEENADLALDSFVNNYNEFEKAVLMGDYKGVSELVDVESWARYYLLSEFTSNPDAYITSWYLYKDGESDVIHAGLGWDFDAAFGNRSWGGWPEGFYLPTETMARLKFSFNETKEPELDGGDCYYDMKNKEDLVSPTMCYLVDMPEFRELVSNIYRDELMGRRDEVLNYVKDKADYIREAALRDDEIWGGDFDEEVKYLSWWVEERFNYFDEIYVFGGLRFQVEATEI